MTTLHTTVQDYLLADTGVTGSPCKRRIYVDAWLPDDYKVEDGPAVVITPRGGIGTGITRYDIQATTFVIRAFAVAMADAFSVDDAVFTALKKTNNPANATAFYAKDRTAPDLRREEGGLYVVSSQFDIAEVI